MRIRSAAILIQNNSLALLERHRAGMHYFTFPGGGMDAGETPEQAVVRETREELADPQFDAFSQVPTSTARVKSDTIPPIKPGFWAVL